jgi:O-methyltransferase involved in polyketide biosynthesis
VTDEWLKTTTRQVKVAQIDATTPNVARVWNYLLGGRDNFEADRKAARQLIAAAPVMSEAGLATRAFHGRAVRFAAEEGIRQYLDIGTGMPTAGNTHDIAQAVAPESRIVYVDNDPVVLAHARALLTSTREGAASYIEADARDVQSVLATAAETLDFSQPVAVILIGILNFIAGDDARRLVQALRDAIAPGSYLVITQPASDLDPSLGVAALRWNQIASTPMALRSHAEVTSWADGLELTGPGVVQVTQWRPDEPAKPDEEPPGSRETPAADVMPIYALVARKA